MNGCADLDQTYSNQASALTLFNTVMIITRIIMTITLFDALMIITQIIMMITLFNTEVIIHITLKHNDHDYEMMITRFNTMIILIIIIKMITLSNTIMIILMYEDMCVCAS